MKALISIKNIIDYNSEINIKKFKKIDTSNVKMIINPYDEIAIEEAIKLKENNKIKKIIAISCGDSKSKNILRIALAMGVDKAILIKTPKNIILTPLIIAKLLKFFVKKKKPDIIFFGKQSVDKDYCQTGQILASILNWPQAIFVSKIKIKKKKIFVSKEIENGIEKIFLYFPAIITVDLNLNEPRYISIIDIINAKKKNIKEINYKKININLITKIKLLKIKKNIKNKKIVKIIDTNKLIKKLKKIMINF